MKREERERNNRKTDRVHLLFTATHCRAGLNDLYSASQKSLESEMKLRKQLEDELDLVKSLKQEKEVQHLAWVVERSLGGGVDARVQCDRSYG